VEKLGDDPHDLFQALAVRDEELDVRRRRGLREKLVIGMFSTWWFGTMSVFPSTVLRMVCMKVICSTVPKAEPRRTRSPRFSGSFGR
jgi:hypothetical protein